MISPQWQQRQADNQSQRVNDHRSVFQRDKARVLHSAAFRRLQSKTQVLGVGLNDFHRTRLTHSLEVAQIGQGIVAQLQQKFPDLTEQLELDSNLIETLCLAHDIGHPAFGHGGEIALHCMMHNDGGFEGNGQTFRIISRLEPYTQYNGMNLTRRTMLGLIKYPNTLDTLRKAPYPAIDPTAPLNARQWHPPKGLFNDDIASFEWLISAFSSSDQQHFMSFETADGNSNGKTRFKSFDCSIMELADDIAYAIHDLEDAITMDMVDQQQFFHGVTEPLSRSTDQWFSGNMVELTEKLFSRQHYLRKDAIGALVNKLVTAITIEKQNEFEHPLLDYQATVDSASHQALNIFKKFVFQHVIRQPAVQRLEFRGQQMIVELFNAFDSDPLRLLPENTAKRWQQAQSEGKGKRVICDYIAGMTDGYANRMHRSLFSSAEHGY